MVASIEDGKIIQDILFDLSGLVLCIIVFIFLMYILYKLLFKEIYDMATVKSSISKIESILSDIYLSMDVGELDNKKGRKRSYFKKIT